MAQDRHFGRAAQRLFIAQTSLSYAIRQLEQRLGVTLVDRSDRRAFGLTSAGETFLAYAREVTQALALAVTATQAAGRNQQRQLRIGYNDGEPLARRPGALGAAVRQLAIDVTFQRLAWGGEGDAVRAARSTSPWSGFRSTPAACTSRCWASNRAGCAFPATIGLPPAPA